LTTPNKCTVSKETQHFLELYTNNLFFTQMYVNMKGIGREPIYATTAFKGNRFLNKDTSKFGKQELVIDEDKEANAFEKQKNKIEKYTGNVINDSDEEASSSSRSHDQATHRQLID